MQFELDDCKTIEDKDLKKLDKMRNQNNRLEKKKDKKKNKIVESNKALHVDDQQPIMTGPKWKHYNQ